MSMEQWHERVVSKLLGFRTASEATMARALFLKGYSTTRAVKFLENERGYKLR